MSYRVGRGGWISYRDPDGTGGLHVRVDRDRNGDVVVRELYLHAGEITADTLRRIPIGRIEAAVSIASADHRARRDADGDLTFAGWLALASTSDTSEVSMGELQRQVPPEGEQDRSDRERLTRPEGRDPDAFYLRVAEAYREYVATSRRPAAEIAAEADVPVGTVHRWVREARRRGYLPSGRKGRSG